MLGVRYLESPSLSLYSSLRGASVYRREMDAGVETTFGASAGFAFGVSFFCFSPFSLSSLSFSLLAFASLASFSALAFSSSAFSFSFSVLDLALLQSS